MACGDVPYLPLQVYRHPSRPGIAQLSMFEVDGRKSKVYCQNLCLIRRGPSPPVLDS